MLAAGVGLAAARLWLLPVRDGLSFAIFIASLFPRKLVWRDRHDRVEPPHQQRRQT
jgi:hypothetical protein